jgi:tetratricopeptide (TPR) repeat protein
MKQLPLIVVIALALSSSISAQKSPSAAATPAPQTGRRPPQAKTQPEFKDYNTAYAITGGAAMEKAANDFAAKYPDSELRPYLYSKAMQEYQRENNSAKLLAMGEKVVTLDPDNTVALVLTATVLSDNLSDGDQDRAQKIAEIRKNSSHAVESIDVAFVAPASATPEQITAYKNTLLSMAHSSLGITSLKSGDDATAEKELKTAADLTQAQPDAYVWYHLALAQDHQKKYSEALVSVEQALRYADSNPELGKLASGEKERLKQLTGAMTPPAPAPGPPPQAQPSPGRPPL